MRVTARQGGFNLDPLSENDNMRKTGNLGLPASHRQNSAAASVGLGEVLRQQKEGRQADHAIGMHKFDTERMQFLEKENVALKD